MKRKCQVFSLSSLRGSQRVFGMALAMGVWYENCKGGLVYLLHSLWKYSESSWSGWYSGDL